MTAVLRAQRNTVTPPHPCSYNSSEPAEINGDPIYQVQRRLKVVVVGAGASGLLLACKLQRHFDEVDVTVFGRTQLSRGPGLRT